MRIEIRKPFDLPGDDVTAATNRRPQPFGQGYVPGKRGFLLRQREAEYGVLVPPI